MRPSIKALFAVLLTMALAATAQESGYWRAVSQTARSITGDIALTPDRITVNFLVFPIARIRALSADETVAAFSPDPGVEGVASLYRLNIPSTRQFLRKNTLCGSDDTTWMATFASSRALELKLFSGQKPPVFTMEALANSSDLCGDYTYAR